LLHKESNTESMARLADRDHLTLTARGVEDIPEFVDVNLFAASHGLMCPNIEGNRRAAPTVANE